MGCPKCGYEMGAFDVECPRCGQMARQSAADGGEPPPHPPGVRPDQQQPHQPGGVPHEIQSIRFLWAAFLWGLIWAIGNRVWWVACWHFGFFIALYIAPVFLTVIESTVVKFPALDLLPGLIGVGWLVFSIHFAAVRAAPDAWQARAFRDVQQFRQTQRYWLTVWIALAAVFGPFLVLWAAVVVAILAEHGVAGG